MHKRLISILKVLIFICEIKIFKAWVIKNEKYSFVVNNVASYVQLSNVQSRYIS